MPIEQSKEICDRRDFAALANFHKLMEAHEIGVDRGEFAEHFMRSWRGHTLNLIDPYEPYEEMGFDRTGDMMLAIQRMAPWADRVKFIRDRSPDAIKHIPPWRNVDFVYIDGSHLYERVKADINAWWDRMTPGGILAGHDYDEEHAGVRQAVDEFTRKRQAPVYLTYEPHTAASWYCYKR